MSEIPPIGPSGIAGLGRSDRGDRSVQTASSPARGQDRVELSQHVRLLSKLASLPAIREDLVARVREELAQGVYESQEKVDIALQRLAEELEA